MRSFFITSTGTGIGKTLVTTLLCHQLRQQGKRVSAYKPVISGWEDDDPDSDTRLIARSLGLGETATTIDSISPFRYQTPLAPNMAARLEQRILPYEQLINCSLPNNSQDYDYHFIEGVGGCMAPLTDEHTVLDWIKALDIPVIVATGSYLGSLSHTLTAISVLHAHDIPVSAIIVCESEDSTVPLNDTVDTLAQFTGKTTVKILRLESEKGLFWKQAPDLTVYL